MESPKEHVANKGQVANKSCFNKELCVFAKEICIFVSFAMICGSWHSASARQLSLIYR